MVPYYFEVFIIIFHLRNTLEFACNLHCINANSILLVPVALVDSVEHGVGEYRLDDPLFDLFPEMKGCLLHNGN